jgi:expansin (peptidoglycan-binding protein)
MDRTRFGAILASKRISEVSDRVLIEKFPQLPAEASADGNFLTRAKD